MRSIFPSIMRKPPNFTVITRRKMMAASTEVKVKLAGINGEVESSISGMRTAKAPHELHKALKARHTLHKLLHKSGELAYGGNKGIGIVQQDVFLFAGTIYDNIRYGRPDATEEEIFEAAKRAEIYDDILEMSNGFQTYVGERGVMLSGGQKQRISIARIFLKDPLWTSAPRGCLPPGCRCRR
mgnify:CR=1 FL=1